MGQLCCWNCQSQFQYSCPTCGAIADTQFMNCTKCGAMFPWPTTQLQEPSLHLLSLDPRDKRLVGWNLGGHSSILIPAITTNGRISTLCVANQEDLLRLQNDILLKIHNEWGNCKTHICAGVNFVHPRNQRSSVLIYQVSGSYNAIPRKGD